MMAWLVARFSGRQIAAGFVLCVIVALGASYQLGRIHEARVGAAAMADYKAHEVAAAKVIIQKEVQVVTKTEVEYRDRIQKIYVQGATVEKSIPEYVQPADDLHFGVNAGFVRIFEGAWAGHVDGPAEDSDREPAAVSLSELAAVEAGNATSCRAWREQALGWRAFYAGQQIAINGAAGAW